LEGGGGATAAGSKVQTSDRQHIKACWVSLALCVVLKMLLNYS